MTTQPQLRPVTLSEAKAAIIAWHRHHKPRRSWRWGVGVEVDGALAGVAVVGNPTAPEYQTDQRILEVTRVAVDPTTDPRLNLPSRLYGAYWRAARALGCHTLYTYTALHETGLSLLAASWVPVALTAARPEAGGGSRTGRWLPGFDHLTTSPEPRIRWAPKTSQRPDPASVNALSQAHPEHRGRYDALLTTDPDTERDA